MCFIKHKKNSKRHIVEDIPAEPAEPRDDGKLGRAVSNQQSKDAKDKKADPENQKANTPAEPAKPNGIEVDESAKKMSTENTLKEVPNRMPEVEFVHRNVKEPVFTEDQLL